MKEFLEGSLNSTMGELQTIVDTGITLCELKRLRYDRGEYPDYTQDVVRLGYLLRYMAAYCVEYYAIAQDILGIEGFTLPVSVLSFGCGCGLDYYGFYYAMKDNGINPADNLGYLGYDVVDWAGFDNKNNENATIIVKDILDIESIETTGVNVLFFPKSIGDFSEAVFNKITEILTGMTFQSNMVVLANSLRDKRVAFDANKTQKLVDVFKNIHGFTIVDSPSEYKYYPGKKALRSLFPMQFGYPNEVYEYATTLNTRCPQYVENGENCDDDCITLSRYPVMRATYIKFQTLRMVR